MQETHLKSASHCTYWATALTKRSNHFVDAGRVKQRNPTDGQVDRSAQIINLIEAATTKLVPSKQTCRFETMNERKNLFAD